jgi:sulfonate transport system substrate-binding protein
MSTFVPPWSPPRRDIGRRAFLTSAVGLGVAGLAACTVGIRNGAASNLTAAVPTTVPAGTKLSIAIHTTQIQLTASGQIGELPFEVSQWPNLSAGPDVIQGFRANSVDLANNAGIPPIQARAIGFDTKIVAMQLNTKPAYRFATGPGTDIGSAKDFRGKKIAFSQGQAQGVVVLRALKEAGIESKDVQLVALPSTQFLTALQGRQVDVAPLYEPVLTKYLGQYGKDGARALETDVVDLLSVLWAPTSVLEDAAKAAAIRSFIPFWTRGLIWAWENPDAWIDAYYVKDQGVSKEDGQRIIKANPKPVFPRNWESAIAWEQQTSDLLASGGYVAKTNVAGLFDRRFESVAASSAPTSYRV